MQDILLDENGDLLIENGDLVIGFSDNQHQLDILTATKGEFKEHPEVGVGIHEMLSDDAFTETILEAKKQLEYDGMSITDIILKNDGTLTIDGEYT